MGMSFEFHTPCVWNFKSVSLPWVEETVNLTSLVFSLLFTRIKINQPF